ncbi:hypothetical protein AGDE_15920 [Angomonas deanei]|nr:hypothetical protein AGDE_15920 [Angomonas deanei]|eukprot:EPY18173.1 hypothetical protein AGDE_15920 [Angomonas deanei]
MEYRFRVLSPAESAAAQRQPNPDLVGAYVHGIFLEGCGWSADRGGLVESLPGELTVPLPTIHFEPVLIADNKADPSSYECPLYKVSSRAGALSTTGVSTNYIVTLRLPSLDGVEPDHWVRRGVAALCALDA